MKSAGWDVIFSFKVIPKVSLTWLLASRAAVVWAKRRSLWALHMSHMWKMFQRSSNIQGIDITLGHSSKLNIFMLVLAIAVV
jgi:hypothetical protein